MRIGPRGGAVWSPFRNGKTTVRGGAGVFFDWFDAQQYQQAVQLDGTHQQIVTIVEPGYPNPLLGGNAIRLPNGRVQIDDLDQPVLREANIAVEQQFPHGLRINTMYVRRRGANALRGVNLNAPRADGTRPDPTAGTIADIQSSASSSFDALNVGVNLANPDRRIFVALNYQLAHAVNESTENIGARRLYTVMERLLEDVSFDAPNMSGQALAIDAEYVNAHLADVVKDEDLSRYIL